MNTPLALSSELTIYTAGDARGALLSWLGAQTAEGGPALLDGAAVEELDGAGLQLLLAARRSAAARGLDLDIRLPASRFSLARTVLESNLSRGDAA